ncbi:MAG: RHS repeat-associated core domain-containing protein [Chitinophagales bacterium]
MYYSTTTSLSNTQHYDPFGMLLVGRNWQSTTTYKYGFNGKENVDDVYGNDVAVDFGARVFDPRLGRWLSIDLLNEKYPQLTPYCFVNNNPIIYKEVNGKDFTVSIEDYNRTITISATYYTETDRETSRATNAAMYLNGLSEDYVFVDNQGNEYKIVYNINVVQVAPKGTTTYETLEYLNVDLGKWVIKNNSNNPENSRKSDGSGKGNTFQEDPEIEFYGFLGYADNGRNIQVLDPSAHSRHNSNPLLTDIHEILHTLGISHKLMGTQGVNLEWGGVGTTLTAAGFKIEGIKSKYVLTTATATIFRNGEKAIKGDLPKVEYKVIDKRPTLNIEEGGLMTGQVIQKPN